MFDKMLLYDYRQGESKSASLTGRRFRPDRTAMGACDLFANGEPQACASGILSFHLNEFLKNL
jgi:hypothetical protein